MIILPLMIFMALLLGAGFVAAFLISVSADQFEDLETPAHRILQNEQGERKTYD